MQDEGSLHQGTAAPSRPSPGLTERPIVLMSLLLGLPVVGMVIFGTGLLVAQYLRFPEHSEPQALQKPALPSNSLPSDGLQPSQSDPAVSTATATSSPPPSTPSGLEATEGREPSRSQQLDKSAKDPAGPAPSHTTPAHFEPDAEGWYVIKDSRTPLDFAEFLEAFPSSRFAADARARLRQLQCQPDPSSSDNLREPAHPPPADTQPILSPFPSSITRMQVRYAQISLRLAGFDPGHSDGICGVETLDALRQYQASRGVPVTGTLDTATQQALQIPSQAVLAAWQQSRQSVHTPPVIGEQSRDLSPQTQQ